MKDLNLLTFAGFIANDSLFIENKKGVNVSEKMKERLVRIGGVVSAVLIVALFVGFFGGLAYIRHTAKPWPSEGTLPTEHVEDGVLSLRLYDSMWSGEDGEYWISPAAVILDEEGDLGVDWDAVFTDEATPAMSVRVSKDAVHGITIDISLVPDDYQWTRRITTQYSCDEGPCAERQFIRLIPVGRVIDG
jgi:hypothetical protein